MSKQEIFEQISGYMHEYFELPLESIHLDSKLFEDLDLDSIDAVDLIVKLQELTGEKIAPESFKDVRTVNDVVDKVYELVQK